MEDQLNLALDEIRPALEMHGGDVEVVRIDQKTMTAHIRFAGACSHCAISEITLKHLIEKHVKKACPEIQRIIAEAAQ